MITVPEAPVGVTAETVAALHNVKGAGDAEAILELARVTVNRALAGAFRTVDQVVYDDLIRRVVGAIVGAKRRPSGSSGQLTTVENEQPVPGARDYLAPVRGTLAQYVAAL